MTFTPGIELSKRFYLESVRPVLDSTLPGVPHSAALLGRGSEVLGLDDEMSADHNCEARVILFLGEDDHARHGEALQDTLTRQLPERFDQRITDHEVVTLRGYILRHLGFDLDAEIEAHDWLTFSEQTLLMFTAGAVHHDDVGLQAARERFAYYPDDIWRYLLLAGWWRVHPEANTVGRAGFVGDELGSALIATQLVHDFMRLCFLMERQYAPYAKWFGTAFSKLACAEVLSPLLWQVLRAETWQPRVEALTRCYEKLAAMHNALAITPAVTTEIGGLWDRPFPMPWGDFPGALRSTIKDPAVQAIDELWPVGVIDRPRDILWPARFRERLVSLVSEPAGRFGLP